LRLLKQNIKIYYAPEVEVMDEKVSAHPVFVNQRRRWVYAQLYFLRNNTGSALQALFSGNFDYANKVLQFALLPRIVVIGLSALLFVYTVFSIHDCIVYSSILLMLLAIALFIPLRSQRSIIKSPLLVFTLFSTFLQMVIAILTANRAAGKFLHTPHKSS
jgi:cellulose synthase/poly-beta-1,6-N-acetylglucosamine synthase-like glycosyltransferase